METKVNVLNFASEEQQVTNKFFSEYTPIDECLVKTNSFSDNDEWMMMTGGLSSILY